MILDQEPEGSASSPDKEPAGAEHFPKETAATALRTTDAAEVPGPPAGNRFIAALWSANTVTVTVLSLVLAMVIGGVLICLSDPDVTATYGYFFAAPGDALSASWSAISEAYANLFKGAIVDPAAVSGWLNGENTIWLALYPLSETLTYTAPLVFTGLAVALAFRGGLFNIGAQGQAIMGAAVAGLVGFGLHLPPGLHVILVLIAGALGGAVYGFVPGILKARTGAHEVITTIMLNYIALYFLSWLIVQDGVQDPNRSDAISKPVDSTGLLPKLAGGDLRVHLGILLSVGAVVAVAWLLNRATFGLELRAVGLNPDAARTAGMSVAATYTGTMVIAGALAGLGGTTVLLGTAGALTGSVAGNIGFDGITVALLGRGKPWGVLLAALLFGALRAGGNRMQSFSGIPVDLVDVLTALIVLFIAAPALVRSVFRLRAGRTGRLETTVAKGW
ncbi:ABC transporter permease [Luedemannella helvata]|uniref:ABC transporter permease n=1 Tax=Luedemannella helvata TaxID=349315 RepID=A0ABP4VQI4_9ACTN